jgi:1,4-dihydroxy-2-naphthoate octaprenyltransferase
MSLARRGGGTARAGRALLSQVHPVFMLPAVATSLFGAVLARQVALPLAGLHAVAVFAALYTAHVKDGYVDFYVRAEDDDHPLSRWGCRVALGLSTAVFAASTLLLGLLAGVTAALVTLPGWLVGYFHAPQLDTNALGATLGYPAGVTLALVGGFYVQAGRFSVQVLALAAVFLVVLAGIKVIDDATDVAFDAAFGKTTPAVVLGPARARLVAFGLLGLGTAAVPVFALALPGIPPAGGLAAVVFGGVVLLAWRAGPELATMLLIRGAYLFLAVLVAAVWFRPLS